MMGIGAFGAPAYPFSGELPPAHGVMLLGLDFIYFVGEKEGLPVHLRQVLRMLAGARIAVTFGLLAGPN
jgi:hypothetical protein